RAPRKRRAARSTTVNSNLLLISESSLKCDSPSLEPTQALPLLYEDPRRFQDRKGDKAHDRRYGHEKGVDHFPAQEHEQADDRDEPREPVADRDLSEQDARPEYRPDRRRVSAI